MIYIVLISTEGDYHGSEPRIVSIFDDRKSAEGFITSKQPNKRKSVLDDVYEIQVWATGEQCPLSVESFLELNLPVKTKPLKVGPMSFTGTQLSLENVN